MKHPIINFLSKLIFGVCIIGFIFCPFLPGNTFAYSFFFLFVFLSDYLLACYANHKEQVDKLLLCYLAASFSKIYVISKGRIKRFRKYAKLKRINETYTQFFHRLMSYN